MRWGEQQRLGAGAIGCFVGSGHRRPAGSRSSVGRRAGRAALTRRCPGAGAVLVAVPLTVSTLGFTTAGITAGSIAAKMMSAAAIANGGGVAAGSTVAVLQSVGERGAAGRLRSPERLGGGTKPGWRKGSVWVRDPALLEARSARAPNGSELLGCLRPALASAALCPCRSRRPFHWRQTRVGLRVRAARCADRIEDPLRDGWRSSETPRDGAAAAA